MPTYRLDIEYDGTNWRGWQIQADEPTIQAAIEAALGTVIRRRVSIVGSGRTDSGVHASAQVAHFQLPQELDTTRLIASINGLLPDSIAVRNLIRATDGFHARYDARSRTYRYRISTLPVSIGRDVRWHVRPAPDVERMNRAALFLPGKRNCSSFCRTTSETENRVCEIYEAAWHACSVREGDFDFVIRADRFLHGMVRTIVGTLIEVGHSKRVPEDMNAIMEAEDRVKSGFAAPAKGLMLEAVQY